MLRIESHKNFMEHTLRRLRSLSKINKARSYLEIGVNTGRTFLNFDFSGDMYAVDPDFKFKLDDFKAQNRKFYACTSDDFFEAHDSNKSFDLVFLDGLHTYDQTLRDLLNCLVCSHKQTLFLVDDTVPSDQFSEARDPLTANQQRKKILGSDCRDLSWHGDTYKLLYYINIFCTKLKYATIMGSGNPQTVIWNDTLRSNKIPCIDLPYDENYNENYLRHITHHFYEIDLKWTYDNCPAIFHETTEEKLFKYLDTLNFE